MRGVAVDFEVGRGFDQAGGKTGGTIRGTVHAG